MERVREAPPVTFETLLETWVEERVEHLSQPLAPAAKPHVDAAMRRAISLGRLMAEHRSA